MSFTALNLSVEDVEFDAEEHTRELQIEQAFKSFQAALRLQKEFKFVEANKEYKELFNIDVVSDLTKPINSPSIRMLRYLAHRNRGLLHLEELHSSIKVIPLESSLELLLNTIDDLIISLQYTDEDFIIETLLLSIFDLIGNDRLSRFVIEYELSNEQTQEITLHERNRLQSCNYLAYFYEREKLLNRIGELSKLSEKKNYDLPKQDLSFLNPILDYLKTRHEKFLKDENKVIPLENISWKSIATCLNDLVPKSKLRTKNEDVYSNCENPITKLLFKLPDNSSPLPQIESEPVVEQALDQAPDQEKEKEKEKETNDQIMTNVDEINEIPDDEEKKRKTEDIPQRSSKRFKEQSDGEPLNDCNEKRFIEDANLFLSNIDMKLDINLNSNYSKTDELYLFDFNNSLNQWTGKHTDAFFPDQRYQGSDNSDVALAELFNSNSLSDSLESNTPIEYLDDSLAFEFIQKYRNCHYIKVRNELVIALLSTGYDGSCLITDFLFEKELYSNLESLVLSSEEILFNQLAASGFHTYAVSIFEILLNRWMTIQQQLKLRGIQPKLLSDLNSYNHIIKPIILKWKKLLHQNVDKMSEVLKFRFKWATLLYIQQSQSSSIENIKDLFYQLYKKLDSNNSSFSIKFLNYEFIPALNLSTIKVQSDKFNVITSFERTFNSENLEETVDLLQRLLADDSLSNCSGEEKSMVKFINEGSVNLRLKLWKVLLGYYFKTSNIHEFQSALNKVLGILLDQLKSEQYNEQPEKQRQLVLISTLAYYSDYIQEFVQLIESQSWKVVDYYSRELLEKILSIFRILYIYINFERSLKGVRNKSFLKFRDTIIGSICAILPLYGILSKDEKYLHFFNVFHAEVGELLFCDALNGKLLDLSQTLLEGIDTTIYEAELLQHMNCKFHISISSDTFVPFDHGTRKQKFKKESAIAFSSYILKTIFKKNYFFQSSFKQDLKHGLDMIYQTISDPDMNDPLFQRNENILDLYIDRPFDLRLFRDSLLGELNDSYRKTSAPEGLVYEGGLYYLEGVLNLNLYKSRKKAGLSKNSDLEYIIKMLRYDLICGSNRIEGWFALGQSYGFQAEDDLTWTSDKLNTIDKKLATAALQKKAILCYLMSVSLIVKNPSKVDNALKAAMFGTLGRELYHSLMRPMDGFAFLASGERKILDQEAGIVEYSYEITDEKRSAILKAASKILKVAISFDNAEWMNYFYLVKVSHKLGKSVKYVIKESSRCCEKFPQGIEPHYQITSLAYKYFRDGKVTGEYCLEILKNVPCYADLVVVDYTKNNVINFIISGLKKLISLDKRKWHHQPRSRISRIYFDLKDFKRSYEEFETIIVLKSTTKNLVNIWKPEFEAPGKHFVYTTIYIDFYIKLADKLADLQGLILFNKKLRRFGASMIDLPSAWDISCTAICNLIKEIIGAGKSYTDIEVPKLVYSEFMAKSEKLVSLFKGRELSTEEINKFVLLYEIAEIRRMNNGFGSTSLTDDTFNAIYLKIYLGLVNTLEDTKEDTPNVPTVAPVSVESNTSTINPVTANASQTNTVKSRVARRDILAVASNLCKAVEQKIKAFRISDEVGYEVPKFIVDAHVNPNLSNELRDDIVNNNEPNSIEVFPTKELSKPEEVNPSVKELGPGITEFNALINDISISNESNKPIISNNEIKFKEIESQFKTITNARNNFNESKNTNESNEKEKLETNKKVHDPSILLKTPETNKNRNSSIDGSSDQDEFHTPTEVEDI